MITNEKPLKKLSLNMETLRLLSESELRHIDGASGTTTTTTAPTVNSDCCPATGSGCSNTCHTQ